MKFRKRTVLGPLSLMSILPVLAATGLTGCASGSTAAAATTSASASDVSAAQSVADVLAENRADHAEDGDTRWDESTVVDIRLTGTSATASGGGVTIDQSTVTITAAGAYRLAGTLSNGQVVVAAPDATVKLILAGASISSSTTAAIAATDADKVVVILADGSQNTLSDTSTYAGGADVNAALFSSADLTIAGTGSLTVRGNGNDAVTSKDGLVIESGTVTVDAVDDGIRGKDYLVVNGGTITVTAGGGSGRTPADDTSTKGLKSGVITVAERGTITVDSSDDAVHSDGAIHLAGAQLTLATGDDGVHADGALLIDGGTIAVSKSVEGLEAVDITLNSGDVTVVASDDGVNAAGGASDGGGAPPTGGPPPGGGEPVGDFSLVVTGGTLVIDAGGDGFDSNGTATMSGGTVVVNGPTQQMNGAIDVAGSFAISGGVLVAAGSAGMVDTPDVGSAQGWLSATLTSAVQANTVLHVVNSSNARVATFVTSKTVQNLVFSSSAITAGATYGIYVGGTSSGGSIGGLAESGDLGSATLAVTVTAGVAPTGGFPGGGGPGGGGPGGGVPSPRPTSSSPTSSSASPSGSPGDTGACRVTNSVSAWDSGLTDTITITNTGTAAINGWSLRFTLASGQTITSGWNATYSPTSGQVTATNVSYNAAIPAGGSTTIGFQASHTGNSAAPSGFTLNGTACS